jgi:hypothetical protein
MLPQLHLVLPGLGALLTSWPLNLDLAGLERATLAAAHRPSKPSFARSHQMPVALPAEHFYLFGLHRRLRVKSDTRRPNELSDENYFTCVPQRVGRSWNTLLPARSSCSSAHFSTCRVVQR